MQSSRVTEFSKWVDTVVPANFALIAKRKSRKYFLVVSRKANKLLLLWKILPSSKTSPSNKPRSVSFRSLTDIREEHFRFRKDGKVQLDRFAANGLDPKVNYAISLNDRIEWLCSEAIWKDFYVQIGFSGSVSRMSILCITKKAALTGERRPRGPAMGNRRGPS
jgi:hypothetical protein